MLAVAVSDTRCVFARLVRDLTGDVYSHALIADPPTDRIFESQLFTGYGKWSRYTANPAERIRGYAPTLATNAQQTAALAWCDETYRGTFYGFGQLVTLGAALCLARIGIKDDAIVRDRLVCSELVYYWIEKLGARYRADVKRFHNDPDTFTPGLLHKYCEASKLWTLRVSQL